MIGIKRKFIIIIFFKYLTSIIIASIITEIILGHFIIVNPKIIATPNSGQFYFPKKKLVRGIEGFISTIIDKNGFNNQSALNKSERTVCVIGDSYTEAFQVDQRNNYSSILDKKFSRYFFYNLGVSGESVAHYISYAKWYEDKLKCIFNIILIKSSDVTEDAIKNGKNHIVKVGNGFKIVSQSNENELKKKVAEFFGGTPPSIISYGAMRLKELYLSSKKINTKEVIDKKQIDYTDQIIWSMNKLKESYKSQIVVLYIPAGIPSIRLGEVVYKEKDQNLKIKKIIDQQCEKLDMGFVDTTEPLNNFFRETGRFPRGFSNTTPGSGHINEFGHKVVADTIANYLEKNDYLEGVK